MSFKFIITKLKNISFYFKISLIAIILCTSNCKGLKKQLPDAQRGANHLPKKIKIDGSIEEWNPALLSFNHATEIYYCITNDDNNLYLLVRAERPEIISKILLGGVTLIVNPSGKKKDEGATITFPTFYKNSRPSINLKNIPKLVNQIQVDSFRKKSNAELLNKLKIIEVEGVKEIKDSLVSIYNDQNIKAAALFDSRLNYNCEMAIPLKFLNLNKENSFSYHIKLSGATAGHSTFQLSGSGRMLLVTGPNGTYQIPASSVYSSYTAMTDFWGMYSLTRSQ